MKPTVYILHGLFSNVAVSSLSSVSMALTTSGYTVKRPEYYGHGLKSGNVFDLHESMKRISAMIDEEPGPVTVIGHSIGGAMALSIGILNPNVTTTYGISAPNGRHGGNADRLKVVSRMFGKDMTNLDGHDFRQILRVMPAVYGECSIVNGKRFFLAHCKSDDIVPFNEFVENVDMLCIPDENILVIDSITGDGRTDHAVLMNDSRTVAFIKGTIDSDKKR